jgi:glycosyltransferase involved in cell wall biosynthesis
MNHPTILAFSGHYLPGYKSGGPVQSVANIVDHLGAEFCFRVVARDRDIGDTRPYPDIAVGKWVGVGRGQVLYLDAAEQTITRIARIMRETPHDAVYLNSFFDPRFTILPLLSRLLGMVPRRPLIVAPRGELSRGALGLKSLKKRSYIAAAKALGLYDHVLWQASSNLEAEDIGKVFGANARVHIASNLPRAVLSGLDHPPRVVGQPLRVLFLSRISPMKNLQFAIDVLARVRVPVEFRIIGPVSDAAYWTECAQMIEALPPHIRVSYEGILPAPEVPSAMAQSDLFFLPTLGENFGHAIIEALGAGTPVLISDQTPWQDLAAAGCGWVEPLSNPNSYAAHIEGMFGQAPRDHDLRRKAALRYAQIFTENSTNLEDNRALFQSAIGGEP